MLGHNQPPLAERLAAAHEGDLLLAAELLAVAKKAPARIDDDDTQTKCAELVKKMRAVEIGLNKAREMHNKPLQNEIAAVNGFYKVHMDSLEKLRRALMQRSEDYLQRKAEAEKRRLVEEEERHRAAAAEARRLADEEEAIREEKTANRLAAKIEGSEADLARTRSLHGAVSTLARQWKCRVIDRALLDKEALWPFINGETLEAALWKWMMAQTPEHRRMPGAYIAQETIGQIR